MGKINVLPFSVANLIAAGEVVDRPASVIKELMENSIDAGATGVTAEIQNGGITFMRVSDNGCGIDPEDLPVALRRHATSKIHDKDDLETIMTLGFRGEALAAISSVADVRILSKTAGQEFGAALEAPCGGEVTVTEQGCSDGTTVIVENLFGRVPARRKFLKKDVTEAMAVSANVEKMALSHPEIAFRLIVDGVVKIETAGDGNLLHTIHAIFGKEVAARMLEVKGDMNGISVRGYTGRSDNYKANRNSENFFINGRFIKSKTIMAALEQAYTSYMPPERFPCCVLYLQIDPSRVDVNVHPSKLEVKFSNEKAVFESVYYAIRATLEANVTRPNINLDSALKKNPFAFPGGKVSEATVSVENGRPESLQKRQLSYPLEQTSPHPEQQRMTAEEYRNTFSGDRRAMPQENPGTPSRSVTESIMPKTPEPRSSVTSDGLPEGKKPEERNGICHPVQAQNPEPVPRQSETEPSPESRGETEERAPWRIVGTVFRCYVIVETGEKMLLIDQHAAHERILFEKLKAGLYQAEPVSQMLMLPVETMMTGAEVEVLQSFDEELKKIGFRLRYAKNTVFADAIPEGIETPAIGPMLSTMAGRLIDNTGSVKLTRDIIFEKALFQAACKAAIKGTREYAPEHIEWLVGKLMELPDITFCPHGRPIAMELTKKVLDRQFDRTGF